VEHLRENIAGENRIPLNVEDDSEIRFDFGGVNDAAVASGKLLDFCGSPSGNQMGSV